MQITAQKPVDLSSVDLRIGIGKELLPGLSPVFKVLDSNNEVAFAAQIQRPFTVKGAIGKKWDYLVQYGIGESRESIIVSENKFGSIYEKVNVFV